ncbi:VOC family protein [Bordetella tumulicola]|uniref:VOC family protein n=1 Tax=Bordetella tumulicola TaxID=1649133 RepID=UPI0039F065B5
MATVKPIPDGMYTLTPHLICDGAAEAIDFYVRAFNAVELARLPGPDGRIMHAMVQIGDSKVMLADAFTECGAMSPKGLQDSPVYLHLYVEDVDAAMAQAEAAGGKVTMAPMDMFWGDRYGQLTDPVGHRWSIATHTQDLTPEQIQEGMKACFAPNEGGQAPA